MKNPTLTDNELFNRFWKAYPRKAQHRYNIVDRTKVYHAGVCALFG